MITQQELAQAARYEMADKIQGTARKMVIAGVKDADQQTQELGEELVAILYQRKTVLGDTLRAVQQTNDKGHKTASRSIRQKQLRHVQQKPVQNPLLIYKY